MKNYMQIVWIRLRCRVTRRLIRFQAVNHSDNICTNFEWHVRSRIRVNLRLNDVFYPLFSGCSIKSETGIVSYDNNFDDSMLPRYHTRSATAVGMILTQSAYDLNQIGEISNFALQLEGDPSKYSHRGSVMSFCYLRSIVLKKFGK